MSEWREAASREALDQDIADYIGRALAAGIDTRGHASLAVSGGSTPRGFFRRLSDFPLDWSRVTITLVDDRWVPPDHPDSNERMARENLLQGPASAAQFIGLKTGHEDPRDGLAEASARLGAITLPFTLTVLGMGGDGHTASWFPQASNLEQLLDPTGTELLGVCDPVTAPHLRMTLTLAAVLNSREILLHIVGEDKRRVLADAVSHGYPVARATEQTTTPISIWWAP